MSDKNQGAMAPEAEDLLLLLRSEIWGRFEKALQKLDPQSAAIFEQFLDGTLPAEIGRQHRLTESQVKDWLDRIKREVAQSLRVDCKVRQ